MVEKSIRGRICHAIHQYVTGNINNMKNYNKNRESWHLMYFHVSKITC